MTATLSTIRDLAAHLRDKAASSLFLRELAHAADLLDELHRIKIAVLPHEVARIERLHKAPLTRLGIENTTQAGKDADRDRATLLDALRVTIAERDEAREWVRKMVRDTQTLTCVYCGHAYPPGTPTHGSDVLTAHIEVCEKHPARKIREERDEARAQLAQAQERLAACEPVIEAVRRKVREAEAMAGEPLYFIQDARTWHGDMIVFWGMNGNGYVVDIMQAGLYPAAHSVGSRDSDLYWRPEDLLGSLTTCANSERLNGKKAQKKPLPPKKGPTP